jgi:hypothetical protein
MLKEIAANYNHADALLTLAIIALIYFAWRSPTVDLSSFGTGIATVFAGRGAHAWGMSQGTQP